MNTPSVRCFRWLLATVSITLSLTLSAQTWNGNGADDNFSTTANWQGGSAPANEGTATATLSGSTRTTPILDTDYSLDTLNIGADGFTLDGTSTLTLGTGLLKTGASYLNFTANVPIALASDITIGGTGTNGSIKLNGDISGAHGITFSGGSGGTLYLGGENTFTGNLQVNGGKAYLGSSNTVAAGSFASGVNVVLSNGGLFGITRLGDIAFDRVISGTGNFSVNGQPGNRSSTTVTLTNQSTFTGYTTITGTLVIGVENALPTGNTLYFGNYGTFKLNANQTVGNTSAGSGGMLDVGSGTTFTANLSANSTMSDTTGAGSVVLTGAYNQQAYGNWTHTGGTTVTNTNLILGNGYVGGNLAGDVLNNGQVTFNRNISITYAGNMSGTGTLSKINSNTLTLTGDITQANTTVTQGAIAIGNFGGTTGSISSNIALSSGTTISFNRSDASTYSGVLSGTGTIEKYGAGSLTLSNTNTVAAAINIHGGRIISSATNALGNSDASIYSGVLEIGADQSIPSFSGKNYGTTLQFNNGSTVTLTSNASTDIKSYLTGTGNIVKQGTGAVTLLGGSINGGGTVDGTITVQQGDLFALGTYDSAALYIANGGTFSSGAALKTGTASFESLTLADGSTLNFGISDATGVAGNAYTGWDLITTTGAVNLDGTSGSPITLAIESLNGAGALGATANFDYNTDYSWNLVTGDGGIVGFDANAFMIDTTNFAEASNPGFTGTLSLSQIGNGLYLNYTAASAVPEPSTYALLGGLCALGLALWRRKAA